MNQLFLLAEIAGVQIAIRSDNIESVVTVGEVVAVPRCDPVIAGLFALRSRVLTLVDCQYRISGDRAAIQKDALAIIATIGGQSFGLLVDKVFDVMTLAGDKVFPAMKLDEEWSLIVNELIDIDGRMVMVVDPERLVAAAVDRMAV